MNTIAKMWNTYWFRRTRIVDLALFRIALIAGQLVFFFPALRTQLLLLNLPSGLYVPLPMLKVLLVPFGHWGVRPDATLITVVWVLGLVSGLLALVGILSRAMLAIFAWSNTILIAHLYSYGQVHHPEAIVVLSLWILVLAPSGASMSIVRLRRRIRTAVAAMRFVPHRIDQHDRPNTSEYALWPLRLVQWMLCLIYLSAAMNKLSNGGLDWIGASTLRYYFIEDATTMHALPGLIAASHPAVLPLLAAVALAFELTFIVVMFVPVLVWVYIPLGVLVHTGIFALQGIRFFQFFFAYVAFGEVMRRTWPQVRATMDRIFKRPRRHTSGEPWTLVYDGFCPLCTRTMVIIDALDVTDQLGYIDFERDWSAVAARAPHLAVEEAREAIHLVSPDGDVYRGYHAFKRLSRQLPALWPAAVMLGVPGVSWLGVRVYAAVARGRAHVVCTPDTCALPDV